jgi:N-acetylglucosaminyl-diphospho-decaprenol L-rhamnosyltransferase
MDLSFIIVAFNSDLHISSCLDSLPEAAGSLKYEVIVVDNHSGDKGPGIIRERYGNVKLERNPKNEGFARAANRGIQLAKGRYFVILNPDIILSSGSFLKIVDYLDCHPDVGLLLPKLVNPDGSLQLSCRTHYDISVLLLRRTPLGRVFPNAGVVRRHLMQDWGHGEICEVDWGLGACMVLRREALNEEKAFDERFFLYFEDVDLCLRMKKAGRKVVYFPGAVMMHRHARQSAHRLFSRAKWEHLRSLIKFYLKHRSFRPRGL